MAKKAKRSASTNADGSERGSKTKAIKAYYSSNRKAKPKEVVDALKAQGIDVSPNTVSVVRAKMGIRRARRKARRAVASNDASAVAQGNKSASLDLVLVLYKAAQGQDVPRARVTKAFLALVETLS